MGLLVNHWHCILPVIAIFAALFLLRNKDEVSAGKKDCEEEERRHEK